MVWATADWTGYFQSDAPVFVAPRMLPCATKLLRPEGKMMSALRFAPLFALLLSACHSAQPPAPNPAAPNFFAGCASAKRNAQKSCNGASRATFLTANAIVASAAT